MIARQSINEIAEFLRKGKVVIVLGARQTRKKTLFKQLSKDYDRALWLNADEYDIQQIFEKPTSTQIKSILGNSKFDKENYLVFDSVVMPPNLRSITRSI